MLDKMDLVADAVDLSCDLTVESSVADLAERVRKVIVEGKKQYFFVRTEQIDLQLEIGIGTTQN